MMLDRPFPAPRPVAALLAALLGCSACSTVGDALAPARVDYQTEGARTAPPLDIPPDLTQLSKDLRFQPPAGGTVSASALQAAAGAAAPRTDAPDAVAPRALGDLRIERAGTQRWLSSRATPEQLWPQLREFWRENGFNLTTDKPELGVMETDWAENRAQLPQDFVRRTIGRVFDAMYDTSQRDLYRTRVERSSSGTEIYISHRGMAEVVSGMDQTRWQARPGDPDLEAEMLARLMVKLAGKPASPTAVAAAASAVAAAPAAPPRARILEGRGTPALQVDDGFDRAWRRVGLALDRSGFTVEDRDRNAGTYYVRYVDPKLAGKEEPGFFARLFGAKPLNSTADRYRVVVKAEGGNASVVSVQDSLGAPLTSESTQRIAELLVAELR